ncbi:MAG: DoxX family membrane protein [Phycisphaerales bacterium]
MLFRDRVALGFSPLFIRLALAVTFLYAGAGKLFYKDFEVQGEQAAALANMGVDIPVTGVPAPPPTEDAQPEEQAGEQADDSQATDPASTPPGEAQGEQPAEEPPAQSEEAPAEETGEGAEETTEPPVATPVRQQSTASGAYTAEQFPTPAPVRRLFGIALSLHDNTTSTDASSAILPGWMGAGARPRYLAWAAALTEFFGGAFILIGFFTRFWALGLACVMAMAMWMTQIGPVVAGGAAGTFGFLPPVEGFASEAWQTLLLQFTLFCAAMSLTFSGPGPVAFDLLFAPRRDGSKSKRSKRAPDGHQASA